MRVQHPSLHNCSSLTPNRTSYPSTNQRLSPLFYTIIAMFQSSPFQFQFFSFSPTLFCPSPSHSHTLSITNTLLITHSLLQPFNASHSQLLANCSQSRITPSHHFQNSTPTPPQPEINPFDTTHRESLDRHIPLALPWPSQPPSQSISTLYPIQRDHQSPIPSL